MKNFLYGILFCLIVLCAGHAQAQTLTSGSTTSDTAPASPPCTVNCYWTETFHGNAGQGIIGTIANTVANANWTILKPDNTTLTSSSGGFAYSSLPVTGTYSIRISSPVSGVALPYTVYYVAGGEAVSNGTLTSGATKHDSLPTGGLNSYKFTGTAGQGVQLRFTAAGAAWNATIFVYKPDGSYWGQGATADTFVNTLPASGDYTVVIQGATTSVGGSYDLSFVLGGGTVSDGTITSGSFVKGSLPVGQMKSYQFSGTAGRGIALGVGDMTWAPNMYVYNPDGSLFTTITANNYFTTTTPLPATGTYTVVMAAQTYTSTGDYTIYFVQSGDSVSFGSTAFPSGSMEPGDLAPAELRSYKISGKAGRAISMHVGATYGIKMIAYKPDGSWWGYSDVSVFNNTSLPADGNYTVVIYPYTYTSTSPGDATFYYVQGNDSVSDGWLESGLQRGGTMARNAIRSYKFKANYPSTLNISTSCTFGTYGCYGLLFKPDGSYWGYFANSYGGGLPTGVSGEYTLVLYEYTGVATGSYTITVTPTSVPNEGTTDKEKCTTCGSQLSDINAAGAAGGALSQGPAGAPILAGAPGAPSGAPVGASPSGALAGAVPAALASGIANTGKTTTASRANVNGAPAFAGNPFNFDLGFKEQTETDYQAGGLNFTRIYRSDSTWTNNTVGYFWRHNFARTLNVSGSNADITDGTGSRHYYTLVSSVWIPNDPSNMAILATAGSGYTYQLPNGTIEKYDSGKKLTRIEYQGGGALNLTYNGSSQLTGIANENGRSLSLTYDGSGRVATLVTPDGTFSYSYDANSNLTTLTKPDTHTKQYLYTNGSFIHALTGIKDEKGNQIWTFAYDVSGRVISTQGAGGVDQTSVTYNTNSSVVTNALGKAFTNYFIDIQNVRRIVQVNGAATTNTPASSMYYSYDALGRMVSKTDWMGNITYYWYDGRSNLIGMVEGAYTSAQRVTKIYYNATWNLPSDIVEKGRVTSFAYDAYGRLTTVTVTIAGGAQRTTTYSYYSNSTDPSGNTILGRLHTIDGPRDDVSDITTYAYDAHFDLTTVTNALSQVTTVTARDSAGRPTAVSDPNSTSTHIVYDTNGNVTSVIRAYGTGLAATTGFTYDVDELLTKITLPNSVYTQYSYDNAQRLTGVNDVPGNTITYTLDNAGNATQTVYKNTTPTTTYTHTRTYDELSRLLHSVGAASQTAAFAWDLDSNLSTYTDPRTHATSYTYDALQRLATSTDALSGVVTPGYDVFNHLTSMKDQRNNSTTYTYNYFGDVTAETSPDRGSLSYAVDKAGNVTQRTDARSVVTNFTYDAINRLSTVAYPSDSSLNATLTYDSSSGCGTPYIGHLCSITDAAGTTAYQYDVLGRVTQAKDTRSSLNFTTSYSYDLAGNITGLTLPSGRTVTYTRDSNGRVSGVSATVNGSSTILASSGTYLPFGPMKGFTYGNSLTFTGTYDTDYYLTNRTVSGSIYNWTYTTDANGNITQAGATTYGYDNLNRVNAENPGSSISYTYDATSNRLTKVSGGTTTTTVPSTSNKISAVGGNSYTYDSSGNITADGVNTYTWNAEGELSVVKVSGTTVGTYTYNLYRQRAKKASASTSYYVYGAGGLLYGDYDNSGNFIREYIYVNGAPLAQINSGTPEVLTYLHADHLGTPRFATNSGGSQVWSWNNDAFGTSAPSGSPTVNLRMPGQYYDSESGLFYNINRTYNPAIGRYISADPIGIAGGLNTFGYVGQSPVNLIDRWGWKPGDPYPTLDEAANAALAWIYPRSLQEDVEYSGSIYVWYDFDENGKWAHHFSYTTPIHSDPPSSSNSPPPSECEKWVPEGKIPVAGYHTHPGCLDCKNPEDFSPADEDLANGVNEPEYMESPSQTIHEYIPPKYVAPDFSTPNWWLIQ
jgi:RHS repeat-associated protein